MSTIKHTVYDAIVSLLTTELNSLANNARAIGSAAGASSTAQPLLGDFELGVTFGSSPTAGTTVDLYLLRSLDDTNYVDGGTAASATPNFNSFVGSFVVQAKSSAQRISIDDVPMPPGLYKPLVVNNGTGQAFTASGHTLKVRTHSKSVV